MKFRVPPQWPQAPTDWIPDPGWKPDTQWPPAPSGWQFWVNDYDVPIEGPRGLYGSTSPRLRWTRIALSAGAALLTLLFGVIIGSAGSAPAGAGSTLAAAPTRTVTAPPAPRVTVTAPAETVTAPAETVTVTPAPVTVTVEVPVASDQASGGLGFVAPPAGGDAPSAYYANCSEARAAGAAPLYRGEPGYRPGLDRDDDGVACES